MSRSLHFLLLTIAALTACKREPGLAHGQYPAATSAKPQVACDFALGTVGGQFCRVSIYSLIVDPQPYVGRRIFTTAYLEVGPGPSLGLAPSLASFEADDLIGCVQVVGPLQYAKRAQTLADGTYAVEIVGSLQQPRHNLCMARIEQPVIVDARPVPSR